LAVTREQRRAESFDPQVLEHKLREPAAAAVAAYVEATSVMDTETTTARGAAVSDGDGTSKAVLRRDIVAALELPSIQEAAATKQARIEQRQQQIEQYRRALHVIQLDDDADAKLAASDRELLVRWGPLPRSYKS
jgi:uncharacterized protein YlxW (UPF0749 family)